MYETQSFWEATTHARVPYPRFQGEARADVVVVGGGITGATTAWLLALAGRSVILLEAERMASGTTGWSTGNLYVGTGPYLHKIEKDRDRHTMITVARTRSDAVDFIDRTAREQAIDCDFARRPWFLFTISPEQAETVDAEAAALSEAGFPVEAVSELPHLSVRPVRAYRLSSQAARVHPIKYTLGVATRAAAAGARLYEYSRVTGLESEGEEMIVRTQDGTVRAKDVVLATHIPIGIHPVQSLASANRSYVVAAKLDGPVPDAYYWDESQPFHAVTSHASSGGEPDTVMIAGSHHHTGAAEHETYARAFEELEATLRQWLPVREVVYRWSAQHYTSGDRVPYIGRSHGPKSKIWIATGFYADGLVYGTAAARILADRIVGRPNDDAEVFEASRPPNLPSLAELLKGGLSMLGQYVSDLPLFAEKGSFDDTLPGQGAVVSIDGEKVGAYRDEQGALHLVSAVCTHMKCVLAWNEIERTWDCPCHGSRFDVGGHVIEGPAVFDLPARRLSRDEEHLEPNHGEEDFPNPIT